MSHNDMAIKKTATILKILFICVSIAVFFFFRMIPNGSFHLPTLLFNATSSSLSYQLPLPLAVFYAYHTLQCTWMLLCPVRWAM